MFVPIIIDPCNFYDYRYLWVYLRYLYLCYKNQWAIIASSEFGVYRQKRPISNVYEIDFCESHQYHLLSEREESSVHRFFIDPMVFSALKERKGSLFETKLYLLKNRYKPLEQELKKLLFSAQKITGQEIEGIIVWNACYKSVRFIAKRWGIPIITSEFAIRFPEFYNLSFFCRDEIFSGREIEKLFGKFKREINDIKIDLFTREELLFIFLNDQQLKLVKDQKMPSYEMGIAGGHPIITTLFAKTMYTDLELIEDVRKEYSEDDIIFRKHPGDEPYRASYTVKNQDESKYSSEFIRKCKRIAAIGSNTLLEAMLWGKPIYSPGIMSYTIFGEKSITQKDIQPVCDLILNFILLVYLAPYNKLGNPEYIRWRLKERNCNILFMTHAKYYLKERNIPERVLYLNKGERIKEILLYRERGANESI